MIGASIREDRVSAPLLSLCRRRSRRRNSYGGGVQRRRQALHPNSTAPQARAGDGEDRAETRCTHAEGESKCTSIRARQLQPGLAMQLQPGLAMQLQPHRATAAWSGSATAGNHRLADAIASARSDCSCS